MKLHASIQASCIFEASSEFFSPLCGSARYAFGDRGMERSRMMKGGTNLEHAIASGQIPD
jgi:hypothetical protein